MCVPQASGGWGMQAGELYLRAEGPQRVGFSPIAASCQGGDHPPSRALDDLLPFCPHTTAGA